MITNVVIAIVFLTLGYLIAYSIYELHMLENFVSHATDTAHTFDKAAAVMTKPEVYKEPLVLTAEELEACRLIVEAGDCMYTNKVSCSGDSGTITCPGYRLRALDIPWRCHMSAQSATGYLDIAKAGV